MIDFINMDKDRIETVISVADKSFPMDADETELCMTNADHTIDIGLEEDLKDGKVGKHTAWNFIAYLWFEDDKFYSEVWISHCAVETFCSSDLNSLAVSANNKYGWQ